MTVPRPRPDIPLLKQPVTSLHGVGPERAALLARLDVRTVEDLLFLAPRRYEDRRRFRPIHQLQAGESALVQGRVVACGTKHFMQRTKCVFEMVLDDGTARLHCRWWNLPFMAGYFKTGEVVVAFGKVLQLKPRQMDHPETEVVETGDEAPIHLNRITPVYPLTEGLPQRWLRALIWRAVETCAGAVEDPLPEMKSLATEPPLPSRPEAVRLLHRPAEPGDPEQGRQRLALDELFALQCRIRARRANFEARAQPLPCRGDNRLVKPFLSGLGFPLTQAQKRVLRELRQDLSGPHPMRRLLQGDVGSGKTLVAACCSLMVLESGYDVALMAPTEILAEQHFLNFKRWLAPLSVPVELRTGARDERADAPPPAAPGDPPPATLTIGTHALIEAGFAPDNLGLVIVDEQHRFGVHQREQLVKKGRYPHALIMTATPIPRTLGLAVYGDLDISLLDELPARRGRIKTFVRTADKLPKVWEFIKARLAEGRQAYVIYPRVEETGETGIKAVTRELGAVQAALAPFKIGLLHGRLRPKDKEQVMAAFRANEIQVLLSTSLVEVGIDVPNATVMLVENAEHFGLSQLHQLRGRIGRGAHDSWCILLSAPKNETARERLAIMEQTQDGFRIAEADLRLRGPGELLGREQSGLPNFKFADLARDGALVERARRLAAKPETGAGPPTGAKNP